MNRELSNLLDKMVDSRSKIRQLCVKYQKHEINDEQLDLGIKQVFKEMDEILKQYGHNER